MAGIRAQRRLAAILAADVVGYSRLMEQDETGTLTALKARRRDILAPLVAQHNGRVVKLMGDGVLVESFNVASSSKLAFSTTQLTIQPTNVLPRNQQYYVLIPAGAVIASECFRRPILVGRWPDEEQESVAVMIH